MSCVDENIANYLIRINNVKQGCREQINAKGVKVTDRTPFEEYPKKISEIKTANISPYQDLYGSNIQKPKVECIGMRDLGWSVAKCNFHNGEKKYHN